MSATHTPGPWTYRIYGDSEMGDTFHLLQGPEGDSGGSILEGGLVLASDAENEANARLLAAAPDLYDVVEELCSGRRTALGIILKSGRAALAKARGEL